MAKKKINYGQLAIRDKCAVDDCENRHYARGMCQMHYRRYMRKLKAENTKSG